MAQSNFIQSQPMKEIKGGQRRMLKRLNLGLKDRILCDGFVIGGMSASSGSDRSISGHAIFQRSKLDLANAESCSHLN